MLVLTKQRKKKNQAFLFIAVLFAIFCITKIIRGSVSVTERQGGIWNYISLVFYPILLFGLNKRKLRLKSIFLWGTLYCITALITACYYVCSLDKATVYEVLMIPYFFIVFSVFYLFSTDELDAYRILELCFWVCVSISLVSLFLYKTGVIERKPMASDVYYSLGLLPFILIGENKRKNIIATILVLLAVFLGNKRAGILALSAALVFYAFVKAYVAERRIHKFKIVLRIAILLLVAFYIFRYIDLKFELGVFDRIARLYEDGGSGRRKIYNTVWYNYRHSDFMHRLFGNGVYSTSEIVGLLAHDDFLEVLYDFGFIAFVFFSGFYLSVIFNLYKMIKRKSPYAPALTVSVIIGLALSAFSYMLTFYTYSTVFVAFWGYCFSLEEKRIQGRRDDG